MITWSAAKRKAFIVSVLRGGSRRWPPKYETLNEAKTEKKVNSLTGRIAQHFRCASCNGEFPAKQVNVDHILPVVDPVVGFVDWNTFVENLYCEKDNLQVLCSTCHTTKTSMEKNDAKQSNTKRRR